MAQGSRWENVCTWFFFFFFVIWSLIFFLLSLSLIPSLFFCFFLPISYAGPFEPRLIGVDRAALRRYNSKPSIFGLKIWLFFLTLEAFLAHPLHARAWCSYSYYPAYYCIRKLSVLILPWGSFKKCWTAITHKYVTAFERIYNVICCAHK